MFRYIPFFLLLIFCSCSLLQDEESDTTPASAETIYDSLAWDGTSQEINEFGMRRIKAKGYSFALRGPRCSLTYDFYMDTTEVTEELFLQHMYAGLSYKVSPNHPFKITSEVELMLFCNMRSRMNGYDTVYEYSGLDTLYNNIRGFTSQVRLKNLKVNYNVIGFRLPTEAEWIYAYKGGTKSTYFWGNSTERDTISQYCWFNRETDKISTESGQKIYHSAPVAQKKANQYGLYDMAGNTFEYCHMLNDTIRHMDSSLIVVNPVTPDNTIALKGGYYGTLYDLIGTLGWKYSHQVGNSKGIRTVLPVTIPDRWNSF